MPEPKKVRKRKSVAKPKNTVEEVYDFGSGIVVGVLSVAERVADKIVSVTTKCADCPRR